MNLNLNNAECLISSNNFTEKVITNICTGEVFTVPFGSLQLASVFLIFLIVAFSIGLMVAMFKNY